MQVSSAPKTAPLSFGQEQWWLSHLMEPDNSGHNVVFPVRLRGDLNFDALQQTFDELLRRHEILRTTYAVIEGEPAQFIAPFSPQPIQVIDLQHLPQAAREAEALRLTDLDARSVVNLAQGPIFRSTLLRLAPNDHVWLRTLHHIACDGWSIRLILHEIAVCYEAFVNGVEPELAPPRLQHGEYARRQREQNPQRWRAHLDFWKEHLRDTSPQLDMLADRHPAEDAPHRREFFEFRLSDAMQSKLTQVAAQEGATLFMLLLAAFAILLGRHGEQEELLIGTALAKRERPETRDAIGFYIQSIVQRHDLTGEPTLREVLRRTRQLMVEGFAHSEVPFRKLVEELRPERSSHHDPLFQAFVISVPLTGQDRLAGLEHGPWPAEIAGTLRSLLLQIKLPFGVVPSAFAATGLNFALQYSTDLFDAGFIKLLAARYLKLLESIAANPEEKIAHLALLPEAEHEQILNWSRGAARPVSEAARVSVHQQVKEQAELVPQAVALESEDGTTLLTYEALSTHALALAEILRQAGAKPGERVALLCDRSTELYVALQAILESGAACVPLDASYPAARLQAIFADAAPRVLLAKRELLPVLGELDLSSTQVLLLDDAALHTNTPAESQTAEASAEDAVYLLYTSGSTGAPKGVVMPHRVLTNLVAWQKTQSREYSCGERAPRTLQFAPLGFDVSWQEIFATWSGGGTLVAISEQTRRDPRALLEVLRARRIERLFLPFVALQQLAQAASQISDGELPHDLTEIISAGEALFITPEIAHFFERLRKRAPVVLQNQYGPTETHVVTAHTLRANPNDWPLQPPIGKPIASAQIYVLDKYRQLAPIGVSGEIAIGGEVLASGYHNDSALTTEKFVDHAFGRLYLTGDRARWTENGELEFLGRRDEQIKIRGFRVEAGEVEAALTQHPCVASAAVVAGRDESTRDSSGVRLAAFIVAEQKAPCEERELRAWLATRLPEYMLPTRWHFVAALPRTPSGKLDRRALNKMRRTSIFSAPARHEAVAKSSVKKPEQQPAVAEPAYGDFEEGQL